MNKCIKCGSDAVFWNKEVSVDPETKKRVDTSHWKCAICSKTYYETRETKQTVTRGNK